MITKETVKRYMNMLFEKQERALHCESMKEHLQELQEYITNLEQSIQTLTEGNKSLKESLNQVEEKCIMYNRSKATPNQCIDFIHNIVLATKG